MEGREIPTTLVLLGRTGNGKSATGNSILGRRAFKSASSSSAVTANCELQQAQLKDGRKLTVIDTPEEAKTLEILQKLFGEKILNYMVVIFTGGDELEENEQTFEDYLRTSSSALKEVLRQCNDRKVIFDNRNKSTTVTEKQRSELLKQIDIVIAQNGGLPYTNELFYEAQERKKLEQMAKAHAKQLEQLQEQLEEAHAKQNLNQINEAITKVNAEMAKPFYSIRLIARIMTIILSEAAEKCVIM